MKRKYPAFVLMHGGPSIMYRDAFGLPLELSSAAQQGYVVLSQNYWV